MSIGYWIGYYGLWCVFGFMGLTLAIGIAAVVQGIREQD